MTPPQSGQHAESEQNIPKQNTAKKKRPSVKYFLTIPFIFLVSLAVLLTGWLAWRYSQNVLLDASHQISQQASERLQLSIAGYLDNASTSNAVLKQPLQTGLLTPTRPDQLQDYINGIVRDGDKGINTLQLGTPERSYYGAGWSKDGQLLTKTATIDTDYAFVTRDADFENANSSAGVLSRRTNYDVTSRPWYQHAVEQGVASQSKAVWSPVYEMFSHKKLGITLSEAVYGSDNALIGVVGTDVLLDELSNQLKQTHISDNTLLFVLDQNNQVIAINQDIEQAKPQEGVSDTKSSSQLKEVSDFAQVYDLPMLMPIMQVLDRAETRQVAFSETQELPVMTSALDTQSTDTARYYIHYSPFNHQGLSWQLVSAMPEQDVLKNLEGIKHSTGWLLLAALLTTFLLTILLAQFIMKSIRSLIEQISSINNDGSGFTSIEYMSKEFNQLDSAFDTLATRLRGSFSMIKQGNDMLEETVIERTRQLEEANTKLTQMTYTDELSQLANRRKFDEFIADAWRYAPQHHRGRLALLMCDIDHFKEYNDTYGHQAGDECIQRIGQMMLGCIRDTDIVARYGGEEFTVVMPGASLESVERVANSIMQNMKQLHIPHVSSMAAPYVTVSAGVVAVDIDQQRANDVEEGVTALIGAADKALYDAKNAGRHCYRVADLS